jgi:hypothetical protein
MRLCSSPSGREVAVAQAIRRASLLRIIDKLNHLFGEATPLRDQAAFVNQIASIARENDVVMAQVESNTRDQAMKGNLPVLSSKAWFAP